MNNLLPIDQFIDLGRKSGAGFGEGDPKIHLAYLTKLGILPQSTKRKIKGEMTGCYPDSYINTLLKVEQMKNKGMTYSQIAKLLNGYIAKELNLPALPEQNAQFNNSTMKQFNNVNLIRNPSFLYLIIGLLFGFLLSTLNSQGLAQMQKQATLTNSTVEISNKEVPPQSVYLMAIPKQNLDKLDKTNINYLITN